ncbi:hypothetical protein EYF80_059341 [Liparis tanakae]|uniref:Uncharacterized protein n=1 Tax=Liparis tanakae TaxID=230148 RepID=A0A4Z2ENJ4_9TELE|nr:hypothetical protein EYF80_059341 [Liparis tanakae]
MQEHTARREDTRTGTSPGSSRHQLPADVCIPTACPDHNHKGQRSDRSARSALSCPCKRPFAELCAAYLFIQP